MHPGDGNAVLQTHQLRQHLRPLNHRHVQLVCLNNLRIFRRNRRARYHHFSASNILRVMTFEDSSAQARQALRDSGTL